MRQWGSGVAQLAERSLPIPEVRSSNPIVSDILYVTCIYTHLHWKGKSEEKRGRELPIFYIKKLKIKSQSLNVRKLALSEWRVGSKTFPLKYCAMLFLLAQPMFENS